MCSSLHHVVFVTTDIYTSKSRTVTSPVASALMILRSSNATVPRKVEGPSSSNSGQLDRGALAEDSTSVPDPFSKSQTHTLPSTPRLTHRPSASANALTGPVCPSRLRTKVSFGAAPAPARRGREERRYSCNGRLAGVNPPGGGTSPRTEGARTTHLPSVCVPATLPTLRPHCSRTTCNFASSIQPAGMSNARVLRVERSNDGGRVGEVKGEVGACKAAFERMTSVTPTLQCAGYTGLA